MRRNHLATASVWSLLSCAGAVIKRDKQTFPAPYSRIRERHASVTLATQPSSACMGVEIKNRVECVACTLMTISGARYTGQTEMNENLATSRTSPWKKDSRLGEPNRWGTGQASTSRFATVFAFACLLMTSPIPLTSRAFRRAWSVAA